MKVLGFKKRMLCTKTGAVSEGEKMKQHGGKKGGKDFRTEVKGRIL